MDYPIGHNIYTFDRFSLAHQNYEFSLRGLDVRTYQFQSHQQYAVLQDSNWSL